LRAQRQAKAINRDSSYSDALRSGSPACAQKAATSELLSSTGLAGARTRAAERARAHAPLLHHWGASPHTGAWLDKERLEEALKVEYFPKGLKDASQPENLYLPDTLYEPLEAGAAQMTTLDEREACRALRGHVLRTEVYADDDSELAGFPYVREQNRGGGWRSSGGRGETRPGGWRQHQKVPNSNQVCPKVCLLKLPESSNYGCLRTVRSHSHNPCRNHTLVYDLS
jgi:hypothetical protein